MGDGEKLGLRQMSDQASRETEERIAGVDCDMC